MRSPANVFAFRKSGSQLLSAAPRSQRRGAEGKRGRGALLRALLCPVKRKGLLFSLFLLPKESRGQAGKGILITAGTERGRKLIHSPPSGPVRTRLSLNPFEPRSFPLPADPKGIFSPWSLCQLDATLKTAPGMISPTPGLCIPPSQLHSPLCPCNALQVCPAQPGNTHYISQG